MPDPTNAEAGAKAATVRRRIARARATIVGTKGLQARIAKHASAIASLRAQLDRQRERVGRHDQRLDGVDKRVGRHEQRLKDLEARAKELEARTKELHRATTLDTVERERRDAQFGAIEVRLGDIEQRLEDVRAAHVPVPLDEEARTEGRGLLDEVRTEHSRIRARMQVVSAYEERLRRVEESVAKLYEGDPRHPV